MLSPDVAGIIMRYLKKGQVSAFFRDRGWVGVWNGRCALSVDEVLYIRDMGILTDTVHISELYIFPEIKCKHLIVSDSALNNLVVSHEVKSIEVENCRFLSVIRIDCCRDLRELRVVGCPVLREIWMNGCEDMRLRVLKLGGCRNDGQRMNLDDFGFLEKINVSELVDLRVRNVCGKTLRDIVGKAKKLRRFEMCECENIDLNVLRECEGLRFISVMGYDLYEHVVDLRGVRKLRSVCLNHCQVPERGGILLPDQLRNVDLSYCHLSNIECIENCVKIKKLKLLEANMSDLSVVGKFVALRKFVFNSEFEGREVNMSCLKLCRDLRIMDVNGTKVVGDGKLGEIISRMRRLSLCYCDFGGMGGTDIVMNVGEKLRSLEIDGKDLVDLSFLRQCGGLRELIVYDAHNLVNIDGIIWCGDLWSIRLDRCGVMRFNALEKCERIEKIELNLCTVEEIGGIPSCRKLSLRDCVMKACSFEGLVGLRELILMQVDMGCIPTLGCRNLRRVHIEKCPGLVDIGAISTCGEIRELRLFDYTGNIEVIRKLAKLKKLSLCCESIDISCLVSCIELESISAWNCFVGLEELKQLEKLEKLRTMYFGGNKNNMSQHVKKWVFDSGVYYRIG